MREGREGESARAIWERDRVRGGPSYIDFCPRHPRRAPRSHRASCPTGGGSVRCGRRERRVNRRREREKTSEEKEKERERRTEREREGTREQD